MRKLEDIWEENSCTYSSGSIKEAIGKALTNEQKSYLRIDKDLNEGDLLKCLLVS